MNAPAAYLPGAEDDIAAAYRYYEERRTGLGNQFLHAVSDLVGRIRNQPRLYGVAYKDFRAAPLRRFPYVVYYRDRGEDVLVVAVQHGRRSVRAWSRCE